MTTEDFIASLVVTTLNKKKFWTVHTDFASLTDEQFEALTIMVEREKARRGLAPPAAD